MPTLALRFADLVTDTIKEHRRFIAGKGAVWWGWWKRASEEFPPFLAEYASAHRPFVICLINYRSGRYYEASCVEIAITGGERIPSPDLDLTPSYYRDAQYSAWFKLISITSLSRRGFARKWAPIPSDPPGTIWLISESVEAPAQPRELAITPARQVEGPVLAVEEPRTVAVQGSAILHLSDLHFGPSHGWRAPQSSSGTVAEAIATDLTRLEDPVRVGIVAITGDLWTLGDTRGPEALRRFVEDLRGRLALEASSFVFVPGNHDIHWAGDDSGVYGYEPQTPYRQAYHLILGHPALQSLCELRYFRLPEGTVIRIAALDSCRFHTREVHSFGWVGDDAFGPLFSRIASDSLTESSVNLAVLHHHLIPAYYSGRPLTDEGLSASLALDSEPLIREMLRNKIKVVLHGHQHHPFISREARVYDREGLGQTQRVGEDQYVYVIGCGSTGAKVDLCRPEGANFYNIYTLNAGRLRIHTRQIAPDVDRGLTYRNGETAYPVLS